MSKKRMPTETQVWAVREVIKSRLPYADFCREAEPLGWDWYWSAHMELWQLCDEYGWSMPDAAALLGILSPRVSVDRNWKYLHHFVEHGELHPWVIPSVRVGANRLLPHLGMGHDLPTLERLAGSPRQVKVWPFASNILNAGLDDRVTVDTWVHKFFGLPPKLKAPTRRAIQVGVSCEAVDRGFTPPQLQAALWTVQRGRV